MPVPLFLVLDFQGLREHSEVKHIRLPPYISIHLQQDRTFQFYGQLPAGKVLSDTIAYGEGGHSSKDASK